MSKEIVHGGWPILFVPFGRIAPLCGRYGFGAAVPHLIVSQKSESTTGVPERYSRRPPRNLNNKTLTVLDGSLHTNHRRDRVKFHQIALKEIGSQWGTRTPSTTKIDKVVISESIDSITQVSSGYRGPFPNGRYFNVHVVPSVNSNVTVNWKF